MNLSGYSKNRNSAFEKMTYLYQFNLSFAFSSLDRSKRRNEESSRDRSPKRSRDKDNHPRSRHRKVSLCTDKTSRPSKSSISLSSPEPERTLKTPLTPERTVILSQSQSEEEPIEEKDTEEVFDEKEPPSECEELESENKELTDEAHIQDYVELLGSCPEPEPSLESGEIVGPIIESIIDGVFTASIEEDHSRSFRGLFNFFCTLVIKLLLF